MLTDKSPWVEAFGLAHPVLLHAPLGLLPALALFEFGPLLLRREPQRGAVQALAVLNGITGALAMASGLILGGSRSGELVTEHKIGGIVLGGLCLLVLVLAFRGGRLPLRLALLGALGTMFYAGHKGGEISHGKDLENALRRLLGALLQPADGPRPTESLLPTTPPANEAVENIAANEPSKADPTSRASVSPDIVNALKALAERSFRTGLKDGLARPFAKQATSRGEEVDLAASNYRQGILRTAIVTGMEPNMQHVSLAVLGFSFGYGAGIRGLSTDSAWEEVGPVISLALENMLNQQDTNTDFATLAQPVSLALEKLLKQQDTATDFATLAQPILERVCVSCHNPDKTKGDLLLTTRAGLDKGGENGVVVVPGKPDESPLVTRCELPVDHDDHMPPDGKKQPTPDEIAALRRWVQNGAR